MPPRVESARSLAMAARGLYPDGPVLLRTLQRYRPFICPFERVIPHVPAGASVLDAGCGAGLFLGLLAAEGRIGRGVGIDISEKAIAAAMRMEERRNSGQWTVDSGQPEKNRDRRGGEPQEGTRAQLRFERRSPGAFWPDERFDVVSMIDVLHHVPVREQEGFVRAACARVAPGGRFIYKDMARRPRWRAAMNRLHDLTLAHQWIHEVPIERVESWACGEGMRLLHGESATRWWYAHELRVFERERA